MDLRKLKTLIDLVQMPMVGTFYRSRQPRRHPLG
jgi:hypothetical protein